MSGSFFGTQDSSSRCALSMNVSAMMGLPQIGAANAAVKMMETAIDRMVSPGVHLLQAKRTSLTTATPASRKVSFADLDVSELGFHLAKRAALPLERRGLA